VLVPAGRFRTGTIILKSNVSLYLETGAVIIGSTELKDYPEIYPEFRSYTDVNYLDKSLIYAEKAEHISIRGEGTLDGQGGDPAFDLPGRENYKKRPYMIRMIECRNVRISGIYLINSPMWVQHYLACEGLLIEGITVNSLVNHNNDGMDIDCCSRVRISNCDINSVIYDTRLAAIALEMVDGGTMDRVQIDNITADGAGGAIFMRLGNRARHHLALGSGGGKKYYFQENEKLEYVGMGRMQNITISNFKCTGADTIGCSISGIPGFPVQNVTLRDIHITFKGEGAGKPLLKEIPENEADYPEYKMFGKLPAYGIYVRHVRDISLNNVRLDYEEPEGRPALFFDDVEGLVLSGLGLKDPSGEGPAVVYNNTFKIKSDHGY
jgi:hypothetical protein